MVMPVENRPKRGPDASLDDPFAFPSDPAPLAKRGRYSPSAAADDLGPSFPLECNPMDSDPQPQVLRDYMANGSTESATPLNYAPAVNRANLATSSEGDVPAGTISTNCSDWAELIVQEMSYASGRVDAKNRAFGVLESFQKALFYENSLMKRAILKQHNQLKDYEEMVQERSQFKQIVEKYQEQIKALEEKNYILSFHLQQANRPSSISSHRNPDIF